MTEHDERCGCPVLSVVPNRRDRRRMKRTGRRAPAISLHQQGCLIGQSAKVRTERITVRQAKRTA